MISLGGGMPNKATFPFKSLSCSTDSGTFELTGADLEQVLQYSGTRGISSLLVHLQGIQQAEHQQDPEGNIQHHALELETEAGAELAQRG